MKSWPRWSARDRWHCRVLLLLVAGMLAVSCARHTEIGPATEAGGGGTARQRKGLAASEDARAASGAEQQAGRRTDDSAELEPAPRLRPLETIALPVQMDGFVASLVDGGRLLLYGIDLEDRVFKRLSVAADGTSEVEVLAGAAFLSPLSCGDSHRALQYLDSGDTRLVSVDARLAAREICALPALGEDSTSLPVLACEGALSWVVWNTDKQTMVQLCRDAGRAATHRLAAPASGWPPHMQPEIAAAAWQGRLYVLRGAEEGGLEAIVVEEAGEAGRVTLSTARIMAAALTPAGDRLLAAWVAAPPLEGKAVRRRQDPAQSLHARWLDALGTPLGEEELLAAETHATAIQLWADAEGRLALGRTDHWRAGAIPHHDSTPDRPLYQPGFASASFVAGHALGDGSFGEWHELGPAAIHSGHWIGPVLSVVSERHSTTDNPFDPSRSRSLPAAVRRFQFDLE